MQKARLRTLAAVHQEPPEAKPHSNHPLHEESQGREEILGIDDLHNIARTVSLSAPDWRSGNPRDLIDRFIASAPDDKTIYTKDNLHLAPSSPMPFLAIYFLGRLDNLPVSVNSRQNGLFPPNQSVNCLRDSIRTKKFLLGVREAVGKLGAGIEGELRVCDAGCGAIPILAIYAALCSDRVKCTALESNHDSADIARSIVHALGLADRIKVIQTDAIKHEPEDSIDLLVSETMHSGLTREPLVQILSNLSRFVVPGGIILPSKVSVMAALGSVEGYASASEFVRISEADNRHMRLDWQMAAEYVPGAKLDGIETVLSTDGFPPGIYFAVVASEVEIGAQKLGLYQSAITVPQVFRDADSTPQLFNIDGVPSCVIIQYEPGDMLEGKAIFFRM